MPQRMAEAEPPSDRDYAYYGAVDEVYNAHWAARRLRRLDVLADAVRGEWTNGHPTKLVLVAGTSGKGSVCRYLEAGLAAAGSTGSYTNPHVWDFRERFSVGGEEVGREEVVEAWESRVRQVCVRVADLAPEITLGPHEICVLLALVLFERRAVEWGAMEVSLGGRYDAVNALDAVATVMTNVGADHAFALGDEVWQRALEKAGIFRPGVPAFTAASDAEARRVLAATCARLPTELVTVEGADRERMEALIADAFPDGMPPDALLQGDHQIWNAALARAVVHRLAPQVDDADLVRSLASARLRARFEMVEPGVYADVAHNPDKAAALLAELDRRMPARGRTILVVGVSGERSPREVLEPILAVADEVIVTSSAFKGIDPETVAADIGTGPHGRPVTVVPDAAEALAEARRRRSGPDDVVLVTGSTYVIDQALNPDPYMKRLNAASDWRVRTLPG